MQTSARYRAVAEIIGRVFEDKQPADNIINAYFRDRRYIGSKDRRFIGSEAWNIIRHRRRLEFEAQSDEVRKIMLVYLKDQNAEEIFAGGEYGLPAITQEEIYWLKNLKDNPYSSDVEAECPKWLYDKIADLALLKSLNQPASADFRINGGNRKELIQKINNEGFNFVSTPFSPIGIRSAERVNLNNCMAFHDGLIEPQDEACQLAVILANVKVKHEVVDFCCGAGGKSLALGRLLDNKGKIEAHDIDFRRMDALDERMKRLRISNIVKIKTEQVGNDYDRFIIDAPCSGSGTWRRSPDAKFRLTPARLKELAEIQSELLENATERVKIGGQIIYMTCSILKEENDEQIEAFLSRHDNFETVNVRELWAEKIGDFYPFDSEDFLHFNPLVSGTDGFFFAALRRKI